MTPPPDADGTPSGGDETHRALQDVLRSQAGRRNQETRSAPSRQSSSGPLLVVALLLTVVAVSVWITPPAWARPEPLPEPSPEGLEAGLRMDMWVAVQRIRDFQAERRRLPLRLFEAVQEAGDATDLRYERLTSETFRLVGSRGEIRITWESTESADALVEPARSTIGGGGGR